MGNPRCFDPGLVRLTLGNLPGSWPWPPFTVRLGLWHCGGNPPAEVMNLGLRLWFNGKTPGFQPGSVGSTPASRWLPLPPAIHHNRRILAPRVTKPMPNLTLTCKLKAHSHNRVRIAVNLVTELRCREKKGGTNQMHPAACIPVGPVVNPPLMGCV